MHIREVEKLTGITKKNIHFYEKKGLVNPGRNSENNYRKYSDEEVRRLKEIKLLRKLGIGLTDIKGIQNGDFTLSECLDAHLSVLTHRKQDLDEAIALCTQIQKKESDLKLVDVEFYLSEVSSAEKSGARFADIAKDFITQAKQALLANADLFFEPDEPIMNQLDFAKELEQYAEQKGKSLTFISMDMSPRIKLDDKIYICALEMPRFFTSRCQYFSSPDIIMDSAGCTFMRINRSYGKRHR